MSQTFEKLQTTPHPEQPPTTFEDLVAATKKATDVAYTAGEVKYDFGVEDGIHMENWLRGHHLITDTEKFLANPASGENTIENLVAYLLTNGEYPAHKDAEVQIPRDVLTAYVRTVLADEPALLERFTG